MASSGTALPPRRRACWKRFAAKVVLSFDPDAAGQGRRPPSSELLVSEGFQVNVAMLPAGDDPDNFIRKAGGAAYLEKLRTSTPYLDYLVDRAARGRDFSKDETRREFLTEMLTVAARIPEAAARDQFADRLAHKAKVGEEVVRAEIRRAAVNRQTTVDERRVPVPSAIKTAERGLIWALVRDAAAGVAAVAELEDGDLDGLAGGPSWNRRDLCKDGRQPPYLRRC